MRPRLTFAASFIATAAVVLYRYPPSASSFYPQCPIWLYLHIQCPGCGSTRAFAALLHGHFAEALRLNALTVIALPALALYALVRRTRAPSGTAAPALRMSPEILCGCLVALTAFTVVRNL